VIVSVPGRAFALIDVVLAVALELIRAHDITGPIRQRVDRDALAIAPEPVAREVRQLTAGVRMIGIGVPLA
jgi:hypothetical protein